MSTQFVWICIFAVVYATGSLVLKSVAIHAIRWLRILRNAAGVIRHPIVHHTKADMNPFKMDGIVDGVDYMPRKESEELLKYHKAGRAGKSSLWWRIRSRT